MLECRVAQPRSPPSGISPAICTTGCFHLNLEDLPNSPSLFFAVHFTHRHKPGVEVAMTCMRCQGLLVEIPPLFWVAPGWEMPTEELQMPAWQCLNCGDYVDAVILAHRNSPLLTVGELA